MYENAASAPGAAIREKSGGTAVVYADRFIPDDEKRRARETGDEAQSIPFLKRFTVFNLAQCEGLPDDLAVAVPLKEDNRAIIRAASQASRAADYILGFLPADDGPAAAATRDAGEAIEAA